MTEAKAKLIRLVPLAYANGDSVDSVEVYCPFPVKRIKFIGMGWNTFDGKRSAGYVTSTIPGLEFVCIIGSIGSTDQAFTNEQFEVVLENPRQIAGQYDFRFYWHTGVPYVFTQAENFSLVLQFSQE